MTTPTLTLASASPRRAALLKQIDVEPAIAPTSIDETPRDGELALPYVLRMAEEKARASTATTVVLAADTVVVLDDAILGKPRDLAHNEEMIRALSGRAHQVITAVAFREGGAIEVGAVTTEVSFAALTHDEVLAYVATGEGLDKAGGYGIQGRAAALIEKIDGSYSNVVGLPLRYVATRLRTLGVIGS